MSNVVIIGGDGEGRGAAAAAGRRDTAFPFMRKMKSWGKRFILLEKDAAT